MIRLLLYMGLCIPVILSQNEIRQADYIDDEGRSGIVTGTFENNIPLYFEFVSETEIGSYKESYEINENVLKQVVVEEVSYNRPKFWNETVARSNGDNEWYDPSKSVTVFKTYYFEGGKYSHWKDNQGNVGYPVNKKLRATGETYIDKAMNFVKLLAK